MEKKKISVIVLLALALISPVFANGQKEGTEDTKEDSVKLRIMYTSTDQNQLDIMNKFIKPNLAENFPDVEIEYEPAGGGEDGANKMKTYNASGNLPDIWYNSTDIAIAIINAGNILDFTPYIEKDGFLGKFNVPEALRFSDGKIYSLGSGADTYFTPRIFYHKSVFEKYGLTIPNTWDEFVVLCDKLKAEGEIPLSIMGKGGWAPKLYLIQTMIQSVNPQAAKDLLANKIDFSDPDVMKALDKIVFMAKNEYFPKGVINLDYGPSLEMFTAGRTAMFGGFSWEVSNLSSDPDIGMFMWPSSNDMYKSTDVTQFWGSPLGGYAVNSHSKNIDVAVKIAEQCALMEATYYAQQGMKLNLETGISSSNDSELVKVNNSLYDGASIKIQTLLLNAMDTRTTAEFGTIGSILLTGDYSAEDFVKDFNPIWKSNTWFKNY